MSSNFARACAAEVAIAAACGMITTYDGREWTRMWRITEVGMAHLFRVVEEGSREQT